MLGSRAHSLAPQGRGREPEAADESARAHEARVQSLHLENRLVHLAGSIPPGQLCHRRTQRRPHDGNAVTPRGTER
jgi:hypothetical protein